MMQKFISLAVLAAAVITAGVLIMGQENNNTEHSAITERMPFRIQEQRTETKPANNATASFAEQISKEIIARNPAGPEIVDDQQWLNVADPEAIAQQIIEEALSAFDYRTLKPIVNESAFRIRTGNSDTAISEYFEEFRKIIDEHATSFTQLTQLTPHTLSLMIDGYASIIGAMYALPVPQALVPLHKEEIALLSAQKTAFEYILAYEEDPLRAFLAIKALDALDTELANLKEQFLAYAQE